MKWNELRRWKVYITRCPLTTYCCAFTASCQGARLIRRYFLSNCIFSPRNQYEHTDMCRCSLKALQHDWRCTCSPLYSLKPFPFSCRSKDTVAMTCTATPCTVKHVLWNIPTVPWTWHRSFPSRRWTITAAFITAWMKNVVSRSTWPLNRSTTCTSASSCQQTNTTPPASLRTARIFTITAFR